MKIEPFVPPIAPSASLDDGIWFDRHQQDAESNRINLSWILKLRWGAGAGQVATILYVHTAMGIGLPIVVLLTLVTVELGSNIALLAWVRRKPLVREWVLGIVLAFDILILTCLLYFTGGPFNPFSFLYLVHISLAAVVLRSWWTWGVVTLSVACLGALFIDHRWLGIGWNPHAAQRSEHMMMHLQGMWVAMAVAGVFIMYFVTRVSRDLALRERELARTRLLAARGEKLASLATLAAGAAHELSTPLSTIAVVASELGRAMELYPETEVASDVRLIRAEVERCRDILQRMAADAGEGAEEPFMWIPVGKLVEEAINGVSDAGFFTLQIDEQVATRRLFLPARAVVQSIRGVLKNAAQAAARDSVVNVRAHHDDRNCRIEISDTGPGMLPAVLKRAGEPFFTTKEPGSGMGLGLFLTRAVVERLGGVVDISSVPGSGTTVVLTIPFADGARAFAAAGYEEIP